MKFDDLVYFFTAAKAHSTSIAAEQLHVSQPTVSLAIKRLEAELEVPLFTRSHFGLSLTLAGEEIYQEIPKLSHTIENIKQIASKYKQLSLSTTAIKLPLILNINTQEIIASIFPNEVIASACQNRILPQLSTSFDTIADITQALPYAENSVALFFLKAKNFNITDIPDNYVAETLLTSKPYFIVKKNNPDFHNVSSVSYADIFNYPLVAPYNRTNNNSIGGSLFEPLFTQGNPNIIMHCEAHKKIQHIVANTNYGSIFIKAFDNNNTNAGVKHIPINDSRKYLLIALYQKDTPYYNEIRFVLSQLKNYI